MIINNITSCTGASICRLGSYPDFVQRDGAVTIKWLIEILNQVPDFEDDKNYYVDYGADDFFGKK